MPKLKSTENMIQRIQTLFLLIVAGLLISLFYSNLFYTVDFTVRYTEYTPFLVLNIGALAINVFTIMIYKYRVFQIRLCIINIIVLLCYQIWIAYFFFTKDEGTAFSISAVFPLVCLILTFLALRYIARDEAMVRSAYQLRKIKRGGKRGK